MLYDNTAGLIIVWLDYYSLVKDLYEVLKDIEFGITPITAVEAKEMISSIKSYPLISGFRGEKGVDQKKLAEILQRISQMVTELPMIQELDLNPIIAYEDRVVVVDARIKI